MISERYAVKYVYIKHRGKATPAHAHNFGLKVCKGEFIVFLGADDKLALNYIDKCFAEYCRAKSRAGFVWTGCQEFGASNRLRMPQVARLSHSFSGYIAPGGQLGAMFVPKSVYNEVGNYDERLSGLEDWDWIIRALHKGYIGVSVNEALHFQRVHGKNLTITTKSKNILTELEDKYPLMMVFRNLLRFYRWFELFLRHNSEFRFRLHKRLVRKT